MEGPLESRSKKRGRVLGAGKYDVLEAFSESDSGSSTVGPPTDN